MNCIICFYSQVSRFPPGKDKFWFGGARFQFYFLLGGHWPPRAPLSYGPGSNSLFLIPKSGNRAIIRSDYKKTLSDPIRNMILLDPKSEKIRSNRIAFVFGLVSDRICTSLFGRSKLNNIQLKCLFFFR